jgi:hypothetical protein
LFEGGSIEWPIQGVFKNAESSDATAECKDLPDDPNAEGGNQGGDEGTGEGNEDPDSIYEDEDVLDIKKKKKGKGAATDSEDDDTVRPKGSQKAVVSAQTLNVAVAEPDASVADAAIPTTPATVSSNKNEVVVKSAGSYCPNGKRVGEANMSKEALAKACGLVGKKPQ